jgi:hypothetical protein
MNKAGFGAVTSAGTSQPSFDGTVEKKGFGFATDNIEKKEESQPVSSSGGFGFSAVAQSSDVEEKVQFKPERVEVNMQACPLDPAERANCEACQ